MLQSFVSFLFPIFLFAGFSGATDDTGIENSLQNVNRELQIENFDGIALNCSAELILTQGSPQKVEVEGPDALIDVLSTEVENGTWKIKLKEKKRHSKKLTIHVTMPGLKNLLVSGSGQIRSTNRFDRFSSVNLMVSGSGRMELELVTDDLDLMISGSGEMQLSGEATNSDLMISGSGELDAAHFITVNSVVRISGSGDAEIYVTGQLDVFVSGSGDVSFKGDPKVKAKILGSGEVNKSL